MIRKEYRHDKSKLSNIEAYNMVRRLRKARKTHDEIAGALKDAGFLGPQTGKPATKKEISNMLSRVKKNTKANKLKVPKAPPKQPRDKFGSLIRAVLKESSVGPQERIDAALALLG